MGIEDEKIELGDEVRDTITGFEGIVVARNEWLSGSVSCAVQSTRLVDGKPLEPEWIDIRYLVSTRKPKKPARVRRSRRRG